MPESIRLLSEEESAKVAEVGIETIRQYMQCGLLDPVIKDHRTFFQESDIRTLFFTRSASTEKAADKPFAAQELASGALPQSDASETKLSTSDAVSTEPTAALTEPKTLLTEPKTLLTEPKTALSSTEPKAWESVKFDAPAESHVAEAKQMASVTSDVVSPASQAAEKVEPTEKASESSDVRAQLPAIPNAELLELAKTLREQIQIIRDERDWLRERVEKLESRSEREQMLLLSESENVRKLIQQNDSKPSFWQRALPWFNPRD